MAQMLHIRLLGSCEVHHGQMVVSGVQSVRLQSLLAYLVLHREAPQSRQRLAFLFWPDSTEAQARTNLRNLLHLLRHALPDGDLCLSTESQTVQWRTDAPAVLDVVDFDLALAQAEEARQAGDRVVARDQLQRAADLYKGDLLPDCYDDWILPERERFRQAYLNGVGLLVSLLEAEQDYDAAAEYAQRLLHQDPLLESSCRALMRAQTLAGNRTGAMRTYESCVTLLDRELGVEPEEETAALYERIRTGADLSADEPGLPDVAGLGPVPRHNLPAQTTPFVGREVALDEISQHLQDPDCRLLSLVGPGGIGKTRLALEAAKEQLSRVGDRVLWVPLAQVSTIEGMVSAVAGAVGYATYRASDPWQRLLDDLREERMLVVLDNLEQLLDVDHAVGHSATDLIMEILRSAPGVRILATSRARVNVQSECLLPVSGMACPSPVSRVGGEKEGTEPGLDSVRRCDAVRLFLSTARRLRPGFEPTAVELADVAQICRLVEGLPLAILLAAAWMEMLSPVEIVAELEKGYGLLQADWRDLPERHRSIEAVFDASWRMLDDVERETFGRLSVFRGGFTWEAAQQVVGPSLRTLFSLVHKSFLHRDAAGRYEIHELLRQYGQRKLAERPDERDRIADLHCAYYAQLIGQGEAFAEIDNVRAGWHWAVSRARDADIVRYSGSFTIYLYQGLFPEGVASLEWAARVLRPPAGGEVGKGQGIALGVILIELAKMYQLRDPGAQVELRERLLAEGVSLLRRLGARRELAHIAQFVAWTYRLERDAEAVQVVEESLAFCREHDDLAGVVNLHSVLSELAIRRGAYDEAERLSREALRIGQQLAGKPGVGYASFNLAKVAYFRGQYQRAVQGYKDSIAGAKGNALNAFRAEVSSFLGDALLQMGDYQAAREQHRRLAALWREMALPWAEVASGQYHGLAYSLLRLCDIALALGETERAWERYREALAIARERPQDSLNLDLVVSQAALLAQGEGGARAVELAALVLHHPAGHVEVKKRAQKLLDHLEADLPLDVFAAAQARGRGRDLEKTVSELFVDG